MTETTDRGALTVPRRTLAGGIAWSVPAVAAAQAAPAFAASCNVHNYLLNWGSTSYSHPNATPNQGVATITSTTGGPTVYVVLAAAFNGSAAGDGTLPSGEARNLSVPSATAGSDATRDPAITNLGGLGVGERGVRLQQTSAPGRNNRQTVTVTFRTGSAGGPLVAVRNLAFHIVDIDAITTSPYSDRVELVPNVASTSQTRDANVIGRGIDEAGTNNSTGPWRNTQNNTNVSENSAGARVRVNYPDSVAGAISQFDVTYWTNTGGAQYHRIYLSDFSFSIGGC